LGCTQWLAAAPGAAAAFSETAGAAALSEAAGAAVEVAALLDGVAEDVLGGAAVLGGVEGACAQIGAAIATIAATATPLNRCFIVQSPNRTCNTALSSVNREAVRVSFNG